MVQLIKYNIVRFITMNVVVVVLFRCIQNLNLWSHRTTELIPDLTVLTIILILIFDIIYFINSIVLLST